MLGTTSLFSLGFVTLLLYLNNVLVCNATIPRSVGNPCPASSCGNIRNISYPFRLESDPSNCGFPGFDFELSCELNRTIIYLSSSKFYVQNISYQDWAIRVVDEGLVKDNNCSFRLPNPKICLHDNPQLDCFSPYGSLLVFLSCPTPVTPPYYFDNSCINSSSFSSSQRHSYIVVGHNSAVTEIPDFCTIDAAIPTRLKEVGNHSFADIRHELLLGVDLKWDYYRENTYCEIKTNYYSRFNLRCRGDCNSKQFKSRSCFFMTARAIIPHLLPISSIGIAIIIVVRALCGFPWFFALFIYKVSRRHLSADATIEEFLESQNNLTPIRYSYSEIKKMTKGFKYKLGQGGFGSVFKGKLRSGPLVAIKMLEKSNANGQDFINEVSTIGRIHHSNVVKLIGFCSEGSKRALVYEYMSNGSLEKFIFPSEEEEESTVLNWDKMYKIAVGVAHGIEYIHRGCDIQILHFDIKPQNILLDENFNPKISDFGLAKLYPSGNNIVSLTAARGTIGYIAPELLFKNIGGISNKADIYSFGKLLMEMAARRKNVNPLVEHSSQIYFPSWVYDRFNEEEDIEMGEYSSVDDKKIAKKMIIVSLWCIQMNPADRPSMRKIIEMLDGPIELLQMPPKPDIYPPETEFDDYETDYTSTATSSTI